MPALFDQGFFVRKPAWHNLGVVLDDYPGRAEAIRLAGHDFQIAERPLVVVGNRGNGTDDNHIVIDGTRHGQKAAVGYKALIKVCPPELAPEDDTHGSILGVVNESYGVVQNDVPWDIVEALLAEGAKYETGITLDGGKQCAITALLDEPVNIPGDNSPILPYLCASWTHDGTGSVKVRASSVRQVCANTVALSEAEGKRLGTDFTFRHTKKVSDRIADARMAITGVRDQFQAYVDLATELGQQRLTPDQRELFVTSFIPLPPEALISDRVRKNIDRDRDKVRTLFDGPTIPDAHRFTAYGAHLAGVEYLDHLRAYRSNDTYVGRSILRNEPAKAKLTGLIREVARA